MKRREFIRSTAIAGGAMFTGGMVKAGDKHLPDYMPIVREKMESGYVGHYVERELTAPALLCDERGLLNPAAIGWSRKPLVRANLKGHWPRKKRWNFWNWISPEFSLSATVSDIDFASFCSLSLIDFKTRESYSAISIKRGGALEMPEEVEKSISFESGSVNFSMLNNGGDIEVNFSCKSMSGKPASGKFVIHKPAGHETLNIVVPWSNERFQMNSKHNTLPVEGTFQIRGKPYVMNPETCHGVQDFGRGMWPYNSFWNWAVATGKQGNDMIGVNMGAKWTTGTGSNENGICYNGRLYKVMEDLKWEYDAADWMKPWRIRTTFSDMIDLTLTPFHPQKTSLSLGLLSTGGVNCFGRWNGTLRFDGKTVPVINMIGWAEEFKHRW